VEVGVEEEEEEEEEEPRRRAAARGGGGGRRANNTNNTQHTTHNTQHSTHNTQHPQPPAPRCPAIGYWGCDLLSRHPLACGCGLCLWKGRPQAGKWGYLIKTQSSQAVGAGLRARSKAQRKGNANEKQAGVFLNCELRFFWCPLGELDPRSGWVLSPSRRSCAACKSLQV
jgi:hypothetical protein